MFEWARNPYVLLCGIYVFAPYITNVFIGDPVRGQEVLASWHRTSGLIVALSAPFLGAAADSMRRRLPFLAAIVAVMIPAIGLQWFATPDGSFPLWALGALVIVAGVTFAWTEVLHNAMITTVTSPRLVSRASGLSLSLGNGASVLLLVFVLVTIALPGTLWPGEPLFGLDPAAHEPSRVVTLICAFWYLVFAIPMFLYSADGKAGAGAKLGDAIRNGFANVARTIRKLRDYRNVATFLIARMFYADAKTAILIFSGVYASGVMGWGLIEMLLYGILLSTVAVAGGFVGPWLDERFGSRNAVAMEIGVTLVCLLGMVSMSQDAMFFVIAVDPAMTAWSGPVFQTAPQIAYLAVSMVIGVSITAAYASSRTLMAKLAPKGMEGELFGLYALAGSATVWLGPLLVETFTATYQSQRAGFASIGILLVAGLLLLMRVKPPAEQDG